MWWGVGLVLWGLGAWCAGTSYQAFSYELKCAGRETCSWTTWWEIAYLILSAASVNAMLAAEAQASCTGRWRTALTYYAWANTVMYSVVVLSGAWLLHARLISFEGLLVAVSPGIVLLAALGGWRYARYGLREDRELVVRWCLLGIIVGAYFTYLRLGVTSWLWARGLWFSENDVLHIGLLGWMAHLAVSVAPSVADAPAPSFNHARDLDH